MVIRRMAERLGIDPVSDGGLIGQYLWPVAEGVVSPDRLCKAARWAEQARDPRNTAKHRPIEGFLLIASGQDDVPWPVVAGSESALIGQPMHPVPRDQTRDGEAEFPTPAFTPSAPAAFTVEPVFCLLDGLVLPEHPLLAKRSTIKTPPAGESPAGASPMATLCSSQPRVVPPDPPPGGAGPRGPGLSGTAGTQSPRPGPSPAVPPKHRPVTDPPPAGSPTPGPPAAPAEDDPPPTPIGPPPKSYEEQRAELDRDPERRRALWKKFGLEAPPPDRPHSDPDPGPGGPTDGREPPT